MPATGVTIVRAISPGSAAAFRMETTGQLAATATITVPATGGNAVYLLTNARVVGYRNYLVQRADGTSGAIEELDLFPQSPQVTDPSGDVQSWTPFSPS
jgi:hypothetical protein